MDKAVRCLRRRWWLVLFNILFGIWAVTIWYDVLFGERERTQEQNIEIVIQKESKVS